jgi:hypothetical protein
MPKLDQQISTLEERLKLLKLRHQRTESRKKAIESQRKKKADTRRKILIGTVVMAKIEQKVLDESLLRGWLNDALTSAHDRQLFGLEARGAPLP